MQKIQRPQLTFKILFYAVFDVLGMVSFATGAMWLVRQQALFVEGFPTTTLEAVVATLGGLLLMIWAAAQIMRELLTRASDNA
jgi:hypothetical protein